MASNDYLGVLTLAGRQKLAAAIGGTPLVLQTVRVGDGNGAEIAPNEAMLDLVHRVGGAYGVLSSGRDPVNLQMWRITALIPASDGPFDIREIGVFDAAGDMIAIARHPLVEKRGPGQGVGVELTTDIVFPVSSTAQVTVNFLPDVAVDLARLMRVPFLAVNSVTVRSPPALPQQGDTYLVPTAPTGAWNGSVGKLAMWNGIVWRIADAPVGTIVAASDSGTHWRRIASGWEEWRATATARGIVELATNAETQAGADAERAVTPAGLSSRTATVDRTGIVELATVTEARAGADTERAVTPAGLRAAGDDIVALIPTIASLDARYSRLVPPPADTFYVVGASGNDANTGLAATAAAGFRTIRGAIDAINSRYSALGLINLIVSAGTFNGFSVPLNGNKLWRIKGAGRTSTFINATSTSVNAGRACNVAGASVILEDLALSAYYECAAIGPEGGMLEVISCNFALAGAGSVGIGCVAGQVSVYGNVQFSGTGRACIYSSSLIRLGYADDATTRIVALVWAAGCTVNDANILAEDGGRIRVFPAAFQQSGAPTGKKYVARLNGVINASGGSVTIAGTLAGTTETGGQYI